MKLIRLILLGCLSIVALVLGTRVAPIHAQVTATVVAIQNYAFLPATVTVSAGSTVTWRNDDSVDHQPVSDTGAWDAGVVTPGTSSRGVVFSIPGTYPYHCAIHPDMTGTIVVTGSGVAPTPTATAPPLPSATPVPTNVPTVTPVATLGTTAAPIVTATLAPPPKPTATTIVLFARVNVAHKTVKAGARQTIGITTVPGASVAIVITFPDRSKKRHASTAPASGKVSWVFTQPGKHTTKSKHTATVVVTVTDVGALPVRATRSYTIR